MSDMIPTLLSNSNVNSFVRYFIESSWKEKTDQILCAGSFLALSYYIVSRFIKTDEPPSQDPPSLKNRVTVEPEEPVNPEPSSIPASQGILNISDLPGEIFELHIFTFLNAEELAKIAPVCQLWRDFASSESLAYVIPFPSWLKDIDADVWRKKVVDLEKYGLDLTEVPCINKFALTKDLKPLSKRVENNMGITNMVIPKGLTLNIALQIARDYSVPINYIWPQILAEFGDKAIDKTCILFFTNSIFTGTRSHTSNQHEEDVTCIGTDCRVAIQGPEVRNFLALLILTYLNSPEDSRTQLYSSATYTRLLEKVNNWSLYEGFAPSGLYASHNNSDDDHIGVGASGSSEAIGTRNMGT